jgi:hypothetical protein
MCQDVARALLAAVYIASFSPEQLDLKPLNIYGFAFILSYLTVCCNEKREGQHIAEGQRNPCV